MSPADCPVFFRLSNGDGFSFTAWIRAGEALWEASLRRPTFEPEKLDGRILTLPVELDAGGSPRAIATALGTAEVTHAVRHAGLSPASEASVTAIDLQALPERFREDLELELAPGERIRWWGSPGGRALILPSLWLAAAGAVVGVFAFAWVRGSALCFSEATPESWRFPCGAMAVAGLAMLAGVLLAVVRLWVRAFRVRARTLYLVTDRRALIVIAVGETRVTGVGPEELRFAKVRHGARGSDLVFPTREDAFANGFWSVSGGAAAEAALARLVKL